MDTTWLKCFRIMIAPIVRYCIKRSIKFRDFQESAKAIFIHEATMMLEEDGEKVSLSKLSVMTGVHRKDVSRIHVKNQPPVRPQDVIFRLIGTWQTDEKYTTKKGKPRVLQAEGKLSEFSNLVHDISTDLNPYTVLNELERTGIVTRTKGGITLVKDAFVPSGDVEAIAKLLAIDTRDLIAAVEENMTMPEGSIPNLHAVTEYDNIQQDQIANIKAWLLEQGGVFHNKVRAYLSQYDVDIETSSNDQQEPETPAGVRVIIGGFSRVHM